MSHIMKITLLKIHARGAPYLHSTILNDKLYRFLSANQTGLIFAQLRTLLNIL